MMATTIQSKRKSHIIFLALGFAAMTLAGCASYRPAPPAFHEALNQPYLLDAGDRVRITVFEQPSLSNNYSVDQSGYIAFPLIGSVPARGKTSKQLESIMLPNCAAAICATRMSALRLIVIVRSS